MSTVIIPYKTIFITQPTGDGGILIENNFKTLADLDSVKTTQIANITANYSLKTETQVVANNLSAETIARIAGDNSLQSNLTSSIDNTMFVIGELSGTVNGIFNSLATYVISAGAISGDNLYLSSDAYSMGERLARISEVGGSQTAASSANAFVQSSAFTIEASGNIMNYVSTGSVTYKQISYDAADVSNTISPSGDFDVLILTNCVNPLSFGTPVNMSEGQQTKIILEPSSPGASIYVTFPANGYTSITETLFNSLWNSTGVKPAAAMFEYTKINSLAGKICTVNYTSLEAV